MTDTQFDEHTPMPKDTAAFYCGTCGTVSLDQNNICNPGGKLKKGDWCGSKDLPPPQNCHNKVHTQRYSCENCGKSSMNPALLCEPKEMQLK